MPGKPSTNGVLEEFGSPNYELSIRKVAEISVEQANAEEKIVLARYGGAVVPVRPGIETERDVENRLIFQIKEHLAEDERRLDERRQRGERRRFLRDDGHDRRNPHKTSIPLYADDRPEP